MLPQCWIIRSTHKISWILKCIRWYNFETATCNSQLLLDVDINDVAPTLRQLSEKRQMWTIHGRAGTFPQLCLKVVEKMNSDMTFVWCTGSILSHQIQAIISFSYPRSSRNFLCKGLESWIMITWNRTVWNFQKRLARFRFSDYFRNNYF